MGGFNNVYVSILLRNNDATRNATNNFRHMKELLKLPSCSTSKRSNSLRFVYDKISVHICGLSSLGVASDQDGGLLIPVIMSKLPNEVRLRIARGRKVLVGKLIKN